MYVRTLSSRYMYVYIWHIYKYKWLYMKGFIIYSICICNRNNISYDKYTYKSIDA